MQSQRRKLIKFSFQLNWIWWSDLDKTFHCFDEIGYWQVSGGTTMFIATDISVLCKCHDHGKTKVITGWNVDAYLHTNESTVFLVRFFQFDTLKPRIRRSRRSGRELIDLSSHKHLNNFELPIFISAVQWYEHSSSYRLVGHSTWSQNLNHSHTSDVAFEIVALISSRCFSSPSQTLDCYREFLKRKTQLYFSTTRELKSGSQRSQFVCRGRYKVL